VWHDFSLQLGALSHQGPLDFCHGGLPLNSLVSKNIGQIVGKQLKISGFIWSSLASKYEAKFYEEMPLKVARGEIKYQEDRTIGLEHVGEAILAVLTGKNTGKSVIVAAEE
jgi:NADPH-dependent curcumin reductase CurA